MSVTLVSQETIYHELAARAITETLKHVAVREVVTFSNKDFYPGARHVPVEHFPSITAYCEFMLKGMVEHINTDHVLFLHWDAMVHNHSSWTDEFLEYDYIGAPWPWYPEGKNIGNGGFSLRSRRLLEACADPQIKMDPTNPDAVNEDQVIGVSQRPYLETKGIRYPTTTLAARFGYELGPYEQPSFGFHGQWNIARFADDDTLDFYVEKMNYSGWNIHKWHHTLLALTERGCHAHAATLVQEMAKHSPDLVAPVINWLKGENEFWAQNF